MLQQETWFRGDLGDDFGLILLGPTIAIDLARWDPATNRIATLSKQLFYKIYEQRMTELEAGEYYHFSFEYYRSLAEGLGQRLDIAIAWLNGGPVGAALFMTDRWLSHYHLSAPNDEGRAYKATTLILNSAAERARILGCERLHLGGGARGEDKPFVFKESFGGDSYRYSCLSLICDPVGYRSLAEKRMATPDLPPMRPNFFPEYRA